MLKLHPEFVVKNGKKHFAVVSYEEFLALQELLTDAADLLELRMAKRAESGNRSIPLAEVKRRLRLQRISGPRKGKG
ncbi:MAG: type II toxin-antitoxin system Phd/YefM family antitoxin [Planctomycetes bacterium]|nr:type II toxin-antitoxin system Phd/YefM family antitoxin [Planctomycetota bacterium]